MLTAISDEHFGMYLLYPSCSGKIFKQIFKEKPLQLFLPFQTFFKDKTQELLRFSEEFSEGHTCEYWQAKLRGVLHSGLHCTGCCVGEWRVRRAPESYPHSLDLWRRHQRAQRNIRSRYDKVSRRLLEKLHRVLCNFAVAHLETLIFPGLSLSELLFPAFAVRDAWEWNRQSTESSSCPFLLCDSCKKSFTD